MENKIKNVQEENGQLLILISDSATKVDKYPARDYNPSDSFKIPSIVISQSEAYKLISSYKSLTEHGQVIELEVDFEVEKSFKTVMLDFWFQTIDERIISFIRDFKRFRDLLGRYIHFTPHYGAKERDYIRTMDGARIPRFSENYDDYNECLCDYKYCAKKARNNRMFSMGKDLAIEYVRQKCIYNKLVTENYDDQPWWEYVSRLPPV